MFSRKAGGPLVVQVPSAAQDSPSWRRIAVIAGVGFVVGVTWPRLAGIRLGPNVPEAPSANPSASASAPQATAAPAPVLPVAVAPVAPPPAASSGPSLEPIAPPPAASAQPGPPALTVERGVVVSCRTADGDTLKPGECGKVTALDGIIRPRLHKLADCPEAAGANGKVQFVLHVDFVRSILSADLGRGPTVDAPEALLSCARGDLLGAPLAAVTHDNPRYTVTYAVAFGPESRTATPPGASIAAPVPSPSPPVRPSGEASEETAQVVWEVAIIRDAPKTGKVLARLQRGETLHIGPVKDGWYPVKYGDALAEGWVYRGAIGR